MGGIALNPVLHYTILSMEVFPLIRFDNFKIQYMALKDEIDEAIHRVLLAGWFIMGKELESFEEEFAGSRGENLGSGLRPFFIRAKRANPASLLLLFASSLLSFKGCVFP